MKVIPSRVKHQIHQWRQKIARELIHDTVSGVSDGNRISLFYQGDDAYDSMMDAIASARSFIHLEMYMFLSDATGKAFAEAMAARARENIPVRVIYDSFGSSEANESLWDMMREAGVEVIEYRPVWFWRKRAGLLNRNHRKNLIVDGTIAFTGGMNIGDMWSLRQSGERAWRDTQLRVHGPAAGDINQLFLETWKRSSGQTITCETIEHNLPEATNGSRCMVVGSQGLGDRKQIRHLYSVHLNQAEHSVKMTVPYFVPPGRLRRALRRARQDRKVEISLLMPRDSDVGVVDWIREGLYPKLLSWGICVIEYLGPTLHAKTMVIDNHTAIIGSTNFDILSLHMNRETALVVFDTEIADELNRQWDQDLILSEKVTTDWQGLRPWWRLMMAKLGCYIIRRL